MVHTGIQEEEADLQEYGYYVRSKKDPNMYVRYALTAASHVDDILTRGHRQATAAFWVAVETRFAVKTWDIVDYDNRIIPRCTVPRG